MWGHVSKFVWRNTAVSEHLLSEFDTQIISYWPCSFPSGGSTVFVVASGLLAAVVEAGVVPEDWGGEDIVVGTGTSAMTQKVFILHI